MFWFYVSNLNKGENKNKLTALKSNFEERLKTFDPPIDWYKAISSLQLLRVDWTETCALSVSNWRFNLSAMIVSKMEASLRSRQTKCKLIPTTYQSVQNNIKKNENMNINPTDLKTRKNNTIFKIIHFLLVEKNFTKSKRNHFSRCLRH